MTKITTSILSALILLGSSNTQGKNITGSNRLYFIENKGQVTDQNSAARNDIQFLLPAPGLSVFIGQGQLHYQFAKTTVQYPDLPGKLMDDYKAHKETKITGNELATIKAYRLDVELVGANKNAQVISSGALAYYENYYLAGGPVDGIQAHTFNKITYKNVYPGIDWVIYIKDNKLEHEFVVGQNGDASMIKLKYTGQTSLKINQDGSITATTPMGIVKEHAPYCYCSNGCKTSSAFRLTGDVLSYDVQGTSDVTIDPVLEWGTYYGPDSNNTSQYGAVCDNSGFIYSAGLTYSETSGNVATTGSHQAVYGGGCDAFLVKFDTAGNRIWGTYYGGSGGDWANHVAVDGAGGVYIVGTTNSTSGISTSGSQQFAYGGGGWDAFVARFDAAGTRTWGTYAGGTAIEYPQAVACDNVGHVYISGTADSYTNIATPGAFKPTHGGGHDNFIIQYDNATGIRQWGSYYGGNADEFSGVVAADGTFVYLAGYTSSTTDISTPSAHQPVLGGTSDAYVVRFNLFGDRIWGTYYGGTDPESIGGLCARNGAVYLIGTTNSATGIATPGAYRTTPIGLIDAFLAKFNPDLGSVDWATYFGGPGNENTDMSRIVSDDIGNAYITGFTASTSGITTTSVPQPTYGGGPNDAFFAKFSPGGTIFWSTYYGGSGSEIPRGCAFDGLNAYLTGQTNSPNQIATPGAFIDTGGGNTFYFQGFIAKFLLDDIPMISLSAASTQGNEGNITIYPNPNNGSFTLTGSVGTDNGSAEIIIADVAGRIIWKDETIASHGTISKQITLGTTTPPGTYFVKVISQNNVTIHKLIKY